MADCVWCGAPLDGRAVRLNRRTRCARCGAATTDPWPSADELDSAYADWYRPASGRRFSMLGDGLLRRTRGVLAGRVDEIAPPGPVLDVGAGDGALMDALARRGREVVGLERAATRSDVRDEPLDRLAPGWAAVVFWHSLEHLPEPGEAIRQAARLLPPGGVVVVAVPDADSLQARVFGDRWLHLDLPRHLVHLTSRALVARLELCGFAVERISHVRGGQIAIGWLDGLVGSVPGDLRFYQALRRADARSAPLTRRQRAASLGAGALLAPLAFAGAALEMALRRSGTVYVEARRA
jgi:SAM-dependent methyltransferase